jgi:hypothetical protein
VDEFESAAEAPLVVASTQLKSATQLTTEKSHEVDPPKLQVLAPASAGVAVVVNAVVPGEGKLIGVMLTVLLPAGIVNAPRLGMEAGLPVAVSVPVVAPAV